MTGTVETMVVVVLGGGVVTVVTAIVLSPGLLAMVDVPSSIDGMIN